MRDTDADLSGSRFDRVDLSRSRFREVDLSGAEFRATRMDGATFRAVDLRGVVMRGVELVDVDISGEVRELRINDVDVAGFVDDELDRRFPERAAMRPTDAAGFRRAWDVVERLWQQTERRAGSLDPARLHERVDEEWSFVETLRHLAFATDAWVGRTVLGDPTPWHPLDLPWDEMPDVPGVPRDHSARPALQEVLDLRHDRMSTVRQLVDQLTDEALDRRTDPVDAPGWPEPAGYVVRECLLVVLSEEWQHRLYAERDLDALGAARPSPGPDLGSHVSRPVSLHLSEVVARSAEEVHTYAADPAHLPEWAAGLSGSIAQVDGRWVADSPMGRVIVEPAPANPYGVLDHVVVLPSGERVLNPLRVLPLGEACEVVFTLRRRPGMSEQDLSRDADAVRADLRTLKRVLEARGQVS